MTQNDQSNNSFVATLDELLRFLEATPDNLLYFDLKPSQSPPQGSQQLRLTSFPATDTKRIIESVHPGSKDPRITPRAEPIIQKATETAKLACGINIHPKHGQGWPNIPADLRKVGWVRFPFMSSPAQFPSLEAAFGYFDPAIQAYKNLGVKVILVLNHETYGEGAGFAWNQMNATRWRQFGDGYVATVQKVAQRYRTLVDAYEIWNEGDAEIGNPAAVHIPPADYAVLLDRTAKVIRANAPAAKIVFGGLMSGPSTSALYVSQTKAALGGTLPVDAIGLHPYGKGAPTDRTIFARFGSVKEDIDAMRRVVPDLPLWLTEVGATGTHDPNYLDDAALYLKNLYGYLRKDWAAQVPVVIWFALSDAMHIEQKVNGLFTVEGARKPLVYDAFFNEACK